MKRFITGAVLSLSIVAPAQSYAQTWDQNSASISIRCNKNDVPCNLKLAQSLVNHIYANVDSREFVSDFLPVLIQAAVANDFLADYGPFHADVKTEIIKLVDMVEAIEAQIEAMLTTPALHKQGRKLLSVARLLKRALGKN